jgi:methylisocitrate lyase
MTTTTRRLRDLLATGKTIVRPAVHDPLSARIAQDVGFEFVGIGGFAMGALTTRTEPLLSLTDMTNFAASICATVDLPVMVDVGAGFGEAINVWHTVHEMERVGVAGMQIEDQVFPKRAHYHRDYIEHTIEADHMVEKIWAAVEARSDQDFVICARTDTMRTHDYDEAISRANRYVEAGADIVYVFPNDLEETKRAPSEISAPVVYGVSHGNRVGRPVPTASELESYGYRVVSYPTLMILKVYETMRATLRALREDHGASVDTQRMVVLRKELEDLIGLETLYAIEERTTEKAVA